MKALDFHKKTQDPETGQETCKRYYLEDNGALCMEMLTEESCPNMMEYLDEAGSSHNNEAAAALEKRFCKGEDIEEITPENNNRIVMVMTMPRFEVFAMNSEGQITRARKGDPLYGKFKSAVNEENVEEVSISSAAQYRAINSNQSANRVADASKPSEHRVEIINERQPGH